MKTNLVTIPTKLSAQRRMLLLGLPSSLALCSPLVLLGCGGGGGSSASAGDAPSGGAPTVKGRLALPPGSPLHAQDMQLANAFGTATVSAGGQAEALTLASDQPGVALVLDARGRLVLFGYLDAQGDASSNVLDANAAAVALLFFALGGGQAPVATKRTMLGLIRAEPATAALAAALVSRLAVSPYALGEGDATIQAAVQAAHAAITAASGTAAAVPRPHAFAAAAAVASPFTLQPSQWQSGVEVLQDPGAAGAVVPINHQRRECKLFAYRVGFDTPSGASIIHTDLTKAEALNLGDSLPSTGAVGGVWTTIGELITGNTALAPITGKSVALVQKTGEVKTYCEIVVIGSAFTAAEPAFFSAPRFADQVGVWRETRGRLNMVTWLRDLVFGLLFEVWGVRDLVSSFATYEAAALAWETIDDDVLRTIIARAKGGAMPKALGDLVKAAIEPGGELVLSKLGPAVTGVMTSIAARKAVVSEALLLVGFRSLSSLLLAVPGVVLGAVDLGAVVIDMERAQQADLWSATLIKPTVTLAPPKTQLAPGGELVLSAGVPGAASGAQFVYHWTLTGSDLANIAGDGKAGRTLDTTTPQVNLATTPSTQGAIVVVVEVFEVLADGSRASVGQAQSQITMQATTGTPGFTGLSWQRYEFDYVTNTGYQTHQVNMYMQIPKSGTSVEVKEYFDATLYNHYVVLLKPLAPAIAYPAANAGSVTMRYIVKDGKAAADTGFITSPVVQDYGDRLVTQQHPVSWQIAFEDGVDKLALLASIVSRWTVEARAVA